MVADSVDDVVGALRSTSLLSAEQEQELTRELRMRFRDPDSLLRELVSRQWLTLHQADYLLKGKGRELLLGQYVILERLGEGGMGQVFKVRHRNLDRVQALKLIRPELLQSEQALRRFQREAKTAAALNHPNVVLVFDAGTAEPGGAHFLVMEYVEGIDLQRHLRGNGPLPIGVACEYVRQAALGLQHAHEKGLVHRDIKPANLLLTDRGQLVKVADFGLAFRGVGQGESGPLTGANALIGTPDFMAPEQALDARNVDIRADIYSLGCTLYFLLTGQPPYPGESVTRKLLQHQQEPAPDPLAVRPDLPTGLVATLFRMMAKAPAQRFATPAEVAEALKPFCDVTIPVSLPPSATAAPATVVPPETVTSRVVRPGRPLRFAGLVAGGTVLLAALVLLIINLTSHREEPDEKDPPGHNGKGNDTPNVIKKVLPWQAPELVGVFGEHRLRHWQDVRSLAVSPNRKLVASGGNDQRVYLWRLPDGEPSGPPYSLEGFGDAVTAVAFSPDGRVLATGVDDGRIKLWELDQEGRAVPPAVTLKDHKKSIASLAFSSDGKVLASGSDDGSVYLWHLWQSREKPRRDILQKAADSGTGGVVGVAFASGGDMLVSAWADGTTRFYEVSPEGRQKSIRTPLETGGKLKAMTLSSDGKTLVTANGDNDQATLKLWKAPDWKKQSEWKVEEAEVESLALSPDGALLAVGMQYDEIRLLDARTGEKRMVLRGHKSAVVCVQFVDDRTLASGAMDGSVRLWDVGTGQERLEHGGHISSAMAVEFSPDGSTLASSSADGTVRLWDVASRKTKAVLDHGAAGVEGLAFHPTLPLLASGNSDSIVNVWPLDKGTDIHKPSSLEARISPVMSLAWSSGKESVLALACKGDRTVKLYDFPTWKVVDTLPGHTIGVWKVAFSPVDGKELATLDGGWDKVKDRRAEGVVRLWRRGEEKPNTVTKPEHDARCFAFSPDGQTMAVGCTDRKVRVFTLKDKNHREAGGHVYAVEAITYDRKGKWLASSDEYGLLILREATSLKEQKRWQLPGPIKGLAFSPDGQHLATANGNGTVYLFRVPAP